MKINALLSRPWRAWSGDLMGGLLAAIIGLPMGLAFGMQSGLGPQAGIYTAIILAILASVFGGTKVLITDPTGPMTVVAATVVSMGLAQAGDLASAWPLIVATFMLAGLLELVFGILDLGKYVKYMPYPVLSGFMAGIGIIIISVQVYPILGHASPKGFVNILRGIDQPLAHLNPQALALGLLTIGIVYGLPKLTRKVPAILVALIAGTVVAVAFGMDVPMIGEIPTQLPTAHVDDLARLRWSDLEIILTPAIMLAGLGVIDSLLTSVVADNLTKTRHDSRWTVIGQGFGNLVTGLFGGIPGAGATMGTVTNIKAGASSRVSGIAKGIFLLVIVVGVADYVQYIPMAVLAGILITIGVGIIDYKGVRMLFKVPRQDAAVWGIVLAVTLFDNLLDAVGIGFALSAILFIGRMAGNMAETQSGAKLQDVLRINVLPEALSGQIHVLNLEGPLFFGFADQFRRQCETVDGVLAVIVRMERIPFLDQSGIVTLESAIEDWQQRGIQVYLAGTAPSVLRDLRRVGLVPGLVKDNHCFGDFEQCVLHLRDCIARAGHEPDYDAYLLEDHILENKRKREPVPVA